MSMENVRRKMEIKRMRRAMRECRYEEDKVLIYREKIQALIRRVRESQKQP